MQILKSTIPYIIALAPNDINYLHLSCHHYKDLLKNDKRLNKIERRKRLQHLNQMITLIDLMM